MPFALTVAKLNINCFIKKRRKIMKSVLLKLTTCMVIICMAACATSLMAQSTFGAKAGYTASTFRGTDANNVDWQSGYAGGLFVNIGVLDFFTIQPEVLFRQRGASNQNETFNINQNVRLSYMDVPVLFKLRIPIAETFYPHIYAGPQFSYNIRGDYEISGGGIIAGSELDVRKIDFGGVMGFGLDLVIDKLFLTADFRYGIGALTIDKSDNSASLRNEDLSILLGVGVNFGGK